jgi:hypothetical protein
MVYCRACRVAVHNRRVREPRRLRCAWDASTEAYLQEMGSAVQSSILAGARALLSLLHYIMINLVASWHERFAHAHHTSILIQDTVGSKVCPARERAVQQSRPERRVA